MGRTQLQLMRAGTQPTHGARGRKIWRASAHHPAYAMKRSGIAISDE